MQNTTISLGAVVMIHQIENRYGLFQSLFSDIGINAKHFIPNVKVLVGNKLTHSVSVLQIPETYPPEFARQLGMDEPLAERTLNRTLERIGKRFPIIFQRYQQFLKRYDLVDQQQVTDFSSSYLEGRKSDLASYGYSRDKRPDKLQINFGISTGINGIPTALTIQKGNMQDKKHMREIFRLTAAILQKGSLLIFDTGANTEENKQKIREKEFHFLTLRAKRVESYRKYLAFFRQNSNDMVDLTINDRQYSCVKKQEEDRSVSYIFFSPELYDEQMQIKEEKFERKKRQGNILLKKRKHPVLPSDAGWVQLIPCLQRTLQDIENPYINGLEGFFILESSVDDDPEKILRLYKQRDVAEKFIRALKEGLELRPIRHWNNQCVIGIFFISFLANMLINLTQFLRNISPRKNVKLLKKHLQNLTLTVVYPKNRFQFTILSNVSPEIMGLFGDFLRRYEDKSLNLRW
ncbi:MAG: transposase [Candidatus Thermoplasmatota archaeon]